MCGEQCLLRRLDDIARDHPRVCGEQAIAKKFDETVMGSSPRVRGAEWVSEVSTETGGIIPACAGSRKRRRQPRAALRDHPRVCGEQAAK